MCLGLPSPRHTGVTDVRAKRVGDRLIVRLRDRARVRVKYKLDVEIGGRHYDVGTLQTEPVLTYLQGILSCIGVSTSVGCLSAGAVKVVGIYLFTSGGQVVSQYPSTSGVGSISNLSGSVSLGSFSLSFSATLLNSSLSGSYTVNTLQIRFGLGSTSFILSISNINVSAQNNQVMNVTLSGSVSVTPSGVSGGLYYYAFTEFWLEALNSLGVSTGYQNLPWSSSGNIALGWYVGVYDPNGNVIGVYNSYTSSSTNITGFSASLTCSGLSCSLSITFTLTPTTSDFIQAVSVMVILNTTPNTTVSNPVMYSNLTGTYVLYMYINLPSVTGSTYQVSSGSAYQIGITDSISISTST